ncbi:MAG: hypothetical protein EA406_02290 [Rhodospirillales bacterium]|nr:MAG: hypothetical protein EA406_02290 [Rhodospirillales bacterium]
MRPGSNDIGARLDALSRFLVPHMLLIAASLLVLAMVIIVIVRLWDQSPANTQEAVRGTLELLYFLAGAGLVVTAALALRFAKAQVRQAQDDHRLATRAHQASVFLDIEKRWGSPETAESRKLVAGLRENLGRQYQGREQEWGRIVDDQLTALRHDPHAVTQYFAIMEVFFFLESLGLMARPHRNYLPMRDVMALIEPALRTYDPLFRAHLEGRFDAWKQNALSEADRAGASPATHEEGTFANALYLLDIATRRQPAP